jgi:hypothetical protein
MMLNIITIYQNDTQHNDINHNVAQHNCHLPK